VIPRWLIGAGVALFLMLLGAFVFGGPIVSFWKAQTHKWQAKEETAQDNAAARGLEAGAGQALATEQAAITERIIERNNESIRYVEKANAAPDAQTPLGSDRQQRMRDHYVSLCKQRPAVCASGESPKGDDPALR